MKGFLTGMVLGFGLGVLFAPMSGQDFRDTVASRAGDIADTARDSYGRVKQTAQAVINSSQGESEGRTGTQG
jgi:gas vesicle protein